MYFLLFSTISYVFIHILHISLFLFKFLVLRILFLVEFNFLLNCISIYPIKCFFTIKFSFRTYIYHVYICCINRIYLYIRYRYKYCTKIISLFSHQCNSFFLFFQFCRFLSNCIFLNTLSEKNQKKL